MTAILLTVPTGGAVLARLKLHLVVSLVPSHSVKLKAPPHPVAHKKADWKKVRSPLLSLC